VKSHPLKGESERNEQGMTFLVLHCPLIGFEAQEIIPNYSKTYPYNSDSEKKM